MASKATRLRALALYKELHRLGRDYEPSYDFHGKLRRMFEKNRNLADEEEIEKALKMGEYIKNGESKRFDIHCSDELIRCDTRNSCFVLAAQVSTSEANVPFKLHGGSFDGSLAINPHILFWLNSQPHVLSSVIAGVGGGVSKDSWACWHRKLYIFTETGAATRFSVRNVKEASVGGRNF
ncbi:hypothetical protein AZE42_02382 [Rhizopogon vesiculosus]|uniref:Complex 1 LYR protein domain-containing protein n=1 Tax=Rhizopogon vesiculosus TaxID=180088 RepID=A0A1J8PPP7_9AGAM|nr:hypothetical protein AZE42_02382 [Rhizopogon vesiculosus]